MARALVEIVAAVLLLASVAVGPYAVRSMWTSPGPARVIALTGVQKDGAWTDEVVDGTTYWRTRFQAATPVLRVGEEVVFRLSSADVRHGFYSPELGIGPVTVDPGHVLEVRVTPRQTGEFPYYCTEVCGRCHYKMTGVIRVVGPGEPIEAKKPRPPCHAGEPAAAAPTLVARGAAIFGEKTCSACHGEGGSGGVRNPNYLAGDVPQNNLLAEKMGLFEKEDADAAISLLEKGADLEALRADPPFRTYPQFLAQVQAVRKLILDGNPAGKKDPASFPPPLNMPAWRHHLSDRDIDAVIAYLISQYPWEDE